MRIKEGCLWTVSRKTRNRRMHAQNGNAARPGPEQGEWADTLNVSNVTSALLNFAEVGVLAAVGGHLIVETGLGVNAMPRIKAALRGICGGEKLAVHMGAPVEGRGGVAFVEKVGAVSAAARLTVHAGLAAARWEAAGRLAMFAR